MTDCFSQSERSRVMAAVRSRGNRATELRLVAVFRSHGIKGWRRHRPLPGRPDFVFAKERLAVFVDGCFWHGCRIHCRMPAGHREYWSKKIERNVARDRAVNRMLRQAGWTVLRIWEHSLKRPETAAARVLARLTLARPTGPTTRRNRRQPRRSKSKW